MRKYVYLLVSTILHNPFIMILGGMSALLFMLYPVVSIFHRRTGDIMLALANLMMIVMSVLYYHALFC